MVALGTANQFVFALNLPLPHEVESMNKEESSWVVNVCNAMLMQVSADDLQQCYMQSHNPSNDIKNATTCDSDP